METPRQSNLMFFCGNARDPLPECSQGSVWILEKGEVDVFFVHQGENDDFFFRRYVCSLKPGSLVVPTYADGLCLQAIPLSDSHLVAHSHTTLQLQDWEQGSLSWFDSVAKGLEKLGLGQAKITLLIDENLYDDGYAAIDAGTVFAGMKSLHWLVPVKGAVHPLGMVPAEPQPVPLSHRLWCMVPITTRVQWLTTTDLLARGSLLKAIVFFNRMLLRLLDDLLIELEQKNYDRLAKSQEREERDRDHLLAAAVESLEVRRLQREEDKISDPLLAAVTRVADWYGIKVRSSGSGAGGKKIEDQLEQMAMESRFRFRRVTLQGRWWMEETGAMLAVDSRSGVPLALIPGSGGRLICHAAGSAVGKRVNDTLAGTIDPHAWVFYPPFPERIKTVGEIVRLAFSRDAHLASLISMALAISLLALLPPLVIKILFATAIPSSDQRLILTVAVALISIHCISIIVRVAYEVALAHLEGMIASRMQGGLFDRVLRLPIALLQRMLLGKIHSKWMLFEKLHASGVVRNFVHTILSSSFSFFSLFLMFYFFPGPAVVVLGLTILFLTYAAKIGPWQMAAMERGIFYPSHYWSVVTETLGGINKLRLAGAEDRAFNRWFTLLVERRVRFLQGLQYRNQFQVVLSLYEGTVLLLILIIISIQYDSNALPMGPFMAFLAAAKTFTGAMASLATNLPEIHMVFKDDLPDVKMFLESEVENPLSMDDPETLRGGVEMSRVVFRYQGSSKSVLEGLSLEAQPGEFIALVGPSGCGKSTVLKLLLGIEKALSGGIFYDGRNLDRLDLARLRSQVGVVMQNANLIPGTIFDYIAAGRSCTLDEAWKIAEMVGVDDVIRNLPMGMYTLISEGNASLSGGQIQRLMIARAMAGRPKLLLFDEATSWLDNKTQQHVVATLSRLRITRIIIAHRLSTIRQADRIYVLDKGSVVETGTYDDLLAKGGLFKHLVTRQLL